MTDEANSQQQRAVPASQPSHTVERYVVPSLDYEQHSYKPPTGPVDQVKPRETTPTPPRNGGRKK